MIIYFYRLYLFFYNLYISFFKESITYYKISAEGDQLSINSTVNSIYTLIVYKTKKNTKYRFTDSLNVSELQIPSYTLLGMSVYINFKSYIICPSDFLIVNNILFTPVFNLWLCKHYLKIFPTNNVSITILDKFVDVHTFNGPLILNETTFTYNQK